MLDKELDIPYCGVHKDVIENANPVLNEDKLALLTQWITERYDIHLKKDVDQLSAPWTSCPILQKIKFTNVRREHDRATIWLIDYICKSTDISTTDKMLNCILFRLYNNWKTADLIGMPYRMGYMLKHKEEIRGILERKAKLDPDYVFFTSAFNTGGMKAAVGRTTGEQYIPMRPIAMMEHLVGSNISKDLNECDSPEQVCELLMSFKGIGEFLSYQMFVDFTYIEDYKFSENHFTIAGPGCQMGLDFLFEDKDGMTYEECIFWLRDNHNVLNINFDMLFSDLEPHDRKPNVMSLENCMCEFSKYVRCHEQLADGKHPRARVKYDGTTKSTAKSLFDH